ncbi:MAG: insulinase family protein [Acidobacteria bacterium]|nr:insulinase family protein [Acidobacteriota bacterium]
MQQEIERTVLPNGLTVITERMDRLRSVSTGIWIKSGSRHEPMEQSGISHFIEHMLFKGTSRRTPQEIAYETDALGGHLDAFTSHEMAAYSIKILDEHLPRGFDLITDLVTGPIFSEKEFEKEREVIVEEIKMMEDTPDDLAAETFFNGLWPDSRLGRSVSGTAESLAGLRPDDLRVYWQSVYAPGDIVIAAAGNLRHQQMVELAEKYFGAHQGNGYRPVDTRPQAIPTVTIRPKDHLEQVQIILGAECPSLLSPKHYAVGIMATILGGGVSSRLFLTVREEHGLAYAIEASPVLFSDTGVFAIHAATSPEKVTPLLEITMAEIRRMKGEPPSQEELDRTKELAKASMVLGMESSSARMSNLARQEILFGRQVPWEEVLDQIHRVTAGEVQQVAQEIFRPEAMALTEVGAVENIRHDRSILAC